MGEVQVTFSRNLRFYRELRGLTQMELATRAGMSLNFASMIELGRKFPGPDNLEKLAAALQVEIFQLFLSEDPIGDIEKTGMQGIQSRFYLEALHAEVVAFNQRYFKAVSTDKGPI